MNYVWDEPAQVKAGKTYYTRYGDNCKTENCNVEMFELIEKEVPFLWFWKRKVMVENIIAVSSKKRVRDLNLCDRYWQTEPDNSVTERRVNTISYWLDESTSNLFVEKDDAERVAAERGYIPIAPYAFNI